MDQNPFTKPQLDCVQGKGKCKCRCKCIDCVQGMLPLIDVTERSGGLEVVPRSHCEDARV